MNAHRLRLLWLFAATGLLGMPLLPWGAAAAASDVKGAVVPKIIARAPCDGALGSRVLRSAAEGKAFLGSPDEAAASARLAKMLGVAAIEWDKQMVLIVSGGVTPTSGYHVQVSHLTVTRNLTLTVHWWLPFPFSDESVLPVLSHPGLALLCDRFEGKVRFSYVFPPPPVPSGTPSLACKGPLTATANAGAQVRGYIIVVNHTTGPISFYLDGVFKGVIEPGRRSSWYVGDGIDADRTHFLEARGHGWAFGRTMLLNGSYGDYTWTLWACGVSSP